MRMIRAVAIMLTLTVTITLVGCVSYVDLSDRAIVQAIGIDYLPDKKVYRISMPVSYTHLTLPTILLV